MKEKKTVRMRKYQRRRARAVMEREGVRGMNRHNRNTNRAKLTSYFALNWKKAAKIIPKKKKRRAAET